MKIGPEAIISTIFITLVVVIGALFVGNGMRMDILNSYKSEVIKNLEDSKFSPSVINDSKARALEKGITLNVDVTTTRFKTCVNCGYVNDTTATTCVNCGEVRFYGIIERYEGHLTMDYTVDFNILNIHKTGRLEGNAFATN